MNNLEKAFKGLKKVTPPKHMKTVSKNRLFARIEGKKKPQLDKLFHSEKLREPPERLKTIVKRRLLARIQSHTPSKIKAFFCALFSKRAIAFSLTIVFSFVSIQFLFTSPKEILAQNKTFIVPESGSVLLKHSWEDTFFLVSGETMIQAGDTILTDKNASATIYFFDKSLVRLQPGTEITINKLHKHPVIENTGIINLRLIRGRIWNKALQVQDDFSKFSVETSNSIISTNNAAFTVESSEEKDTSVSTLDRSVNITIVDTSEKKVVAKTKVNEGYQAKVTPENDTQNENIAIVAPIDKKSITEDIWIQENIQKDKEHMEKITEEAIANIKKPESQSFIASIKETQILAGEVKKHDEITENNTILQEAIHNIENGEIEQGETKIQEYQDNLNRLYNETDDQYLKHAIYNEIISKEKEFIALSPESDLRLIKESIAEIKETVADENSKNEIILANANETLNTVYDLLEEKNKDLAKEQLAKYQQKIEQIAQEIQTAQTNAEATDGVELLKEMTEQLEDAQTRIMTEMSAANFEQVAVSYSQEEVFILTQKRVEDAQEKRAQAVIEAQKRRAEENRKKEQSLREFKERQDTRRKELAQKKADEIIEKIHIYQSYDGQYNKLLGSIKELNSDKYSHMKDYVLDDIVNKVPIQLRHKVKEEMSN